MTDWNMPPGCRASDIPGWDAPDPSPLQEQIWSILDGVGMDLETMEKIDSLIEDWQHRHDAEQEAASS